MGDLMKLKRVQFFMSKQSYLASLLAIAALVYYFIGYASIAIILTIAIIICLVIYFILGLVYWRCPYCHNYLPTKDAGSLTVCPHCQKELFRDEENNTVEK